MRALKMLNRVTKTLLKIIWNHIVRANTKKAIYIYQQKAACPVKLKQFKFVLYTKVVHQNSRAQLDVAWFFSAVNILIQKNYTNGMIRKILNRCWILQRKMVWTLQKYIKKIFSIFFLNRNKTTRLLYGLNSIIKMKKDYKRK